MGVSAGPRKITDNLVLSLDAANAKSFDTSQIRRSAAPNTWTAVTTMEENGWRGLCYGNGKFVATSLDGTNRVAWSTDGINWTAASASEQHYWYSVVYGNGKYVSVGHINYSNDVDRVMYSTNGTSWTTANATRNHTWISVCYGNGYFVALAENDYNGGSHANKRIMYSTNGSSWTEGPIVAGNYWKSIAHGYDHLGNGKFVAVSSSGSQRVMYANDDSPGTWSAVSSTEQNYWFDVCYGNGKFVAVSTDGTNQVMYSTNGGYSWTSASAASSGSWYSVTYGNGYFVATKSGSSNNVMYSSDGINWTTASSPITGEPWAAIAYGNGKFVATQLMEGGQGGSSGGTTNQGMCCSDGFVYPTANDISGKGHTTSTNSDDAQSSGSQSLFEFNGLNDHIDFLSNSDITFDADFTVEIWAKFDYLGSDRPIWETRSSTTANDGFLIYVNSSGGLYMKTGTSYTIANSSAGIVTDTWYHIAVSRIGGTVTQYLNAVQSGAQAVGTVTNYSNDDLYIGKDVASTLKMNGKISQVRVYKGKGLTTAEVNRNYDSFKRRFGL